MKNIYKDVREAISRFRTKLSEQYLDYLDEENNQFNAEEDVCEWCGGTGEEYRDEYDKDGQLVGVGTMGPYKCICQLKDNYDE